MADWELNDQSIKHLLCYTFPDLFKEKNHYLTVSNGIEALNIVAYGNACLVDNERKKIFRVGEPIIFRSLTEELSEGGWVPLAFSSDIEKIKKMKIADVLKEKDIPLIFDPSVLLTYDEAQGINIHKILNTAEKINTEYVIVWGKYLGEAFWEYFASLVLRSAGIITGNKGLTNADLHGYYLPDFIPPKNFPYQWSLFMFHLTPLLIPLNYSVYNSQSEVIKTFSDEIKTIFGNYSAGIVIEAESSAYRARTYSKNSGIGQLKEKYLSHNYQIGYIAGPGVDEQSILQEVKHCIGIISSDSEGEVVLVNPSTRLKNSHLSEDVYDFITKLISALTVA